MPSLRKRLADHPGVNRWAEDRLADYLRYAYRTSTFERTGFDQMDACVARGEPVIMALWHQRLVMAGYMFPLHLGPISSLTTSARAGRLAGEVLNRFGYDTVPMSSHKRHVSLSREVLRRIRGGSSIGIAADGPGGPPRVCSEVPLMWARVSGCRVFAVAFSANRAIKLPTWDRLMLPTPKCRGIFTCREWTGTVPRNADEAGIDRLRLDLEATIDAATDEADRAVGRTPDTAPKGLRS
ncbi:DUF374 domain-containing protein [Aestuariivita sp.]|jgi:lysophospholipid acyltransferase (LPLAT)-like uncharacterized protein|uniref:lysophospholipid acyltransferase family protein n=1 Tax=Aestuariivita sp. TaxID=1872407 RepID=UPI00216CEBB9|nr:DUF374 domain-containing protein [Aestuariivita sp.]MCE8007018.1 DUF374 domain-containing protein [Aestuariivita sp.]